MEAISLGREAFGGGEEGRKTNIPAGVQACLRGSINFTPKLGRTRCSLAAVGMSLPIKKIAAD